MNNFNKREYLKLLEKQSTNEKLKSEDFSKLKGYRIMVKNYFNWCIREHYLNLLENFQKGEIKTFDFCTSFQNTDEITRDFIDVLESKTIIISPNEKSLAFADLLEEIFEGCEAYLQNADFENQAGLAMSKNYNIEVKKYETYLNEIEVGLKKCVKENYLKIQIFLKKG